MMLVSLDSVVTSHDLNEWNVKPCRYRDTSETWGYYGVKYENTIF
jgi:hypothetical protein